MTMSICQKGHLLSCKPGATPGRGNVSSGKDGVSRVGWSNVERVFENIIIQRSNVVRSAMRKQVVASRRAVYWFLWSGVPVHLTMSAQNRFINQALIVEIAEGSLM